MYNVKIKNIKSIGCMPVYNMTVSKYHNYLVHGGVILKNCDALRYLCISRTLPTEVIESVAVDEDAGAVEDYEDYMTGGEPSSGYIGY